jgi:hypothetical protein
MDLTLISIVVGLGLTELLLTFYQLVRARRRVSWDALPLAWAALVLVAAVNFWWGIRALMAEASGWLTATFMLAMISPVFLFLACAAALPRVEPGGRLDMKAAYAEERSAFLLFLLGYQCGNWILDFAVRGGLPSTIVAVSRTVAGMALLVALLSRSRRWDWAALAVIGAAYASRLATQRAQ